MENKNTNHQKVRRLVGLALLTAIVAVLQMIGSVIRIGPIPISLVLVPIVLGAVLYGPGAGAYLGGVFGVVVLAAAISGADAFSAELLTISPIGTAAICLGKGVLCGLCAGLVYAALKKHRTAACLLASAVCPVVNTGVFALGMVTIFRSKLLELAGGTSALYFLFIVMIGVNFLVEFGVNVVLSTVISRVAQVVLKKAGGAEN